MFICTCVFGCSSLHEPKTNSEVIVRSSWIDPSMEIWDIFITPDLAPKDSQLSGNKLGRCISETINERHSFSCVELYVDVNNMDFPLGASLALWCDFFEKFEIPYIVTLGLSEGDSYTQEDIMYYRGGDGLIPIIWHTPDEFTIECLTPTSTSTRQVSFDEMIEELEGTSVWWCNRTFSISQSVLDESPKNLDS